MGKCKLIELRPYYEFLAFGWNNNGVLPHGLKIKGRITIRDQGVDAAGPDPADPSAAETGPLTTRLFDEMKEAGVPVGVGRYDEARGLYVSRLFGSGGRTSYCPASALSATSSGNSVQRV